MLSFRDTILDEISLEGLEGITLKSLWIYVGAAYKFPQPLPAVLQQQIWEFILQQDDSFTFYKLPVERAPVKLFNRFEQVDEEMGVPVAIDASCVTRYKYVQIQSGKDMGSCEHYKERKEIPKSKLQQLGVNDVMKTWGDTFVIVASPDLRLNALLPKNVGLPPDLFIHHYCILEAVGRARYNGETTTGPISLINFCDKAAMVFYNKSRLQSMNLVTTQVFSEKTTRKSTVIGKNTLVTLVRFHRSHKNHMETVLEKIFNRIKDAPEQRVPAQEMRRFVLTFERQHYLKKLSQTTVFRRIFETRAIPLSQLTPLEIDMLEKKKPPRSKTAKEPTESCYFLRNPNQSFDELFTEENVETETANEFKNEAHAFVDVNVKDEFYRALLRHGARGCSLSELHTYTCISFLTLRQILKLFLNDGLIMVYQVDMGRQRVQRYVALDFASSAKETVKAPLDIKKKLHCSENPNIPNNKCLLSDIPEIKAEILPFDMEDAVPPTSTVTQRQALRKFMVVRIIDERCITTTAELRNIIQRDEKEKGHTDEICAKSVLRVVTELASSNVLCLYRITLKYNEEVRTYRYVTHPKIDIDHDVLQKEIIKLKNDLFCAQEDRRIRNENRESHRRLVAESKQNNKSLMKIGTNYDRLPKFFISRHLHELLYYLTYVCDAAQEPLEMSETLLRSWQRTEPTINPVEFCANFSESTVKNEPYTNELSWRTFIPPLPNYDEQPKGCVLFNDVMTRIPLSLFNKMFRIDTVKYDQMKSFLSHPVEQHYLVANLPLEYMTKINRHQLHRTYTLALKLLNHMGLIQVTERQVNRDIMSLWVYVNRKASILDTTSTEAGRKQINPQRHYPKLKFTFSDGEKLEKYWTTLHRICFCTKLGYKNLSAAKPGRVRVSELQYIVVESLDAAPQLDNGDVPGDHLGAGGLDTNLFAHKLRSWSWVMHSNVHAKAKGTRVNQIRHKYHKVVKRKGNGGTVTHLVAMPISGGGATTKSGAATKRTPYVRDAIDREALKNMRTLRVKWNKDEDEILKMAETIYYYIAAPVHLLMIRTVGRMVRDTLRHVLGSCNKTTLSCVRRMKFIEKQRRDRPEVPNWLHMLRTNSYMQKHYGQQFWSRLKRQYTTKAVYCDALNKHFLLLVDYLYRYVHDLQPGRGLGGGSRNTVHLLPDTLAEYERMFRECPVIEESLVPYANDPASDVDVQLHTVTNVLHSSLSCARDKTLYNLQAFEIYKHYTENVLQTAFRRAVKNYFVVAVRRKNLQMMPTQLSGPAFKLSSRYRMRFYMLKIPYEVYDTVYAYYDTALRRCNDSAADLDGSNMLQLRSPNVGHLFVIAEGLHRQFLAVQIKLPFNVIAINAEPSSQTSSSSDRIMDHFHAILENAPVTEYSKALDGDSGDKQVHVRFHRANRCYKLHYNPYDRIAKMPAYQLHFFCALASINQSADLKCSRLHAMSDEHGFAVVHCPFKCVLQDADYMACIERIVLTHRDMLDTLSEMPPQQLLNLTKSNDLVNVQPTNLLTLVRMLEAFWREKEAPHELRDIGKCRGKLKSSSGKSVDWLDLCQQILASSGDDAAAAASDGENVDRSDEYEPVMNKEERMVRAQDACVIRLPTLQLGRGMAMRNNDASVAEVLLESTSVREAILNKVINESHWKYTVKTFESVLAQLTDFDKMELQYLQHIHDYIKASAAFGVTVMDLMAQCPIENILLRCLNTLRAHYIIQRVGVLNVRYVHKAFVREWLVHTFHIKRLDQENLGSTANTTIVSRKRKCDVQAADDVENSDEMPTSSKYMRTDSATTPRDTSTATEQSMPVINEQNNSLPLDERPSTSRKRVRFSSPDSKQQQTQQQMEKQTTDKKLKSIASRHIIVMQPKPWIRLNGSVNRRVLDKWLGSVLFECISNCGCTVRFICDHFSYMPPVDLMFLLELLVDLKCVKLMQMHSKPVDLFSDFYVKEDKCVKELYDPALTYVVVQPDATLRMATFMGNKKYNVDFI